MPDWRVHLAIGTATGTAVWLVSMEPLALPTAMIASLAPDIDQPGSYIARRALPFIRQKRFQKWKHVRHRGAWHYQVTAYAAALTVGIIVYHFLPMMIRLDLALAIATGVGWSSHGLADHIDTWRKKIIRTKLRREDFKTKVKKPWYSVYENEDWA